MDGSLDSSSYAIQAQDAMIFAANLQRKYNIELFLPDYGFAFGADSKLREAVQHRLTLIPSRQRKYDLNVTPRLVWHPYIVLHMKFTQQFLQNLQILHSLYFTWIGSKDEQLVSQVRSVFLQGNCL